MARIGIYGGSFNPPHLGHIRAAMQTRERLKLDRVILVPDAVPPHKTLAVGSPDAETRLDLVRRAIQDCDGLEVSDLELRRAGPSYTVDTLRQFCAQYPKDELFLLMGTDMFLCFDRWREPAEISKMAQIVCMLRTQNSAEVQTELKEYAQKLARAFGTRTVFAQNDALELSSTQTRRLLFFGCGSHCVSEAVLQEIVCKGLYGVGKDYSGLSLDALMATCEPLYKPKRWQHALGCSEMAAHLARRWGAPAADARRAGILHDVTKALTDAEQLTMCSQHAIAVTDSERSCPWLLHAKTAAWAAREIFGEDTAICDAIRWHTTGKADMTTLEKIVYIADYTEPGRSFPGVEDVRRELEQDLNVGVLLGMEMSIRRLNEQGRSVEPASVEARDFLKESGVSADEILRQQAQRSLSAQEGKTTPQN